MTEWNAGIHSQEWYVYDALGNRVLRRSTNGSGTTITTYVFGIEEHYYTGAGVNQNNQYYYAVSGRLLGSSNGTTTTFFLTDALGSVLVSNPETSSDPTGHCSGWWDFGCEAQQAWNQTTQVAQTVWNDGFVQPFNSTAHALQTAWDDGFVRPWNATVQAYQHMQDLVVKPLIESFLF